MPVDIEIWCAEIRNFNRCCQSPVARLELREFNVFSTIVMSECVFLCICVSQYYFVFLACFFCFQFFIFCFGTANTQNILCKDKYFALLYWISQFYLSANFIYIFVEYYHFFQCFVLCVFFASPFTSALRYREKSWSTEWPN